MIIGPYTLENLLSRGFFGTIYRGIHGRTGTEVAVKLESTAAPTLLLKHECKILYYLNDRGIQNVPQVEWWGTINLDGVLHRALVIPMLDMTLAAGRHRTTTTTELVRDMIRILYQVHEAGVVHRDIKPQNFMLRDDVVFLIDFGLSSVYVNAEFRGHLPAKPDQEHILGTPKYVSLHVHDGKDASRRDDLISVGYVWLFLLLGGKLPWDSVESSSSSSSSFPSHHIRHDANVERRRQKQQLSRVVLHSPLGKYLEAVYRLEFDERPPYANLIDLVVV
jgi:serine/threonine protein kinase